MEEGSIYIYIYIHTHTHTHTLRVLHGRVLERVPEGFVPDIQIAHNPTLDF